MMSERRQSDLSPPRPPDRYRFGEFVISVSRRQLLRNGHPVPLIPRYFDLLVLLVERRQTAVSRREIFDRVWADVVVSDGALSQAIRTLRRTLGDDSREPAFIRTVSRHGYSFVYDNVIEESEGSPLQHAVVEGPPATPPSDAVERSALIERLLSAAPGTTDEDRRDAAEQLHLLGTAQALEQLIARPGHARAVALLRDTRWNVEGAGPVPLLGRPEGFAAASALVSMRARDTLRLVEVRAISAALGAAAAGMLAGVVGGLVLVLMPASRAAYTVVAVLGLLGAATGAIGAGGVTTGIAAAEAIARSRRSLAIVTGAALGGLLIGVIGQLSVRWTLDALVGIRLDRIGGPLEGLILGFAVGAGYAATTRQRSGGGMATPVGSDRVVTLLVVAICTALAGLLLSATSHPLVGGFINQLADASSNSQVALTPLRTLYSDPLFGRGTKALLAMFESGLFGLGLAAGLTRRIQPR
jgi:transcriptional regulator HilA, main transcriptional regulator of SPI1